MSPSFGCTSEAYIYYLYDLTKDKTANLPRKPEPGWRDPGGRQVYPVTANHFPHGHDEELEPTHEFESESFFWSPDSRYVGFADATGGTESVVLVRVGERDLTTYVHPLKAAELCAAGVRPEGLGATLTNIESSATGGALPEIGAYFSNITCHEALNQPLRLHPEDFKPAKIEVHQKIHRPKLPDKQ